MLKTNMWLYPSFQTLNEVYVNVYILTSVLINSLECWFWLREYFNYYYMLTHSFTHACTHTHKHIHTHTHMQTHTHTHAHTHTHNFTGGRGDSQRLYFHCYLQISQLTELIHTAVSRIIQACQQAAPDIMQSHNHRLVSTGTRQHVHLTTD